MWRTERPPANSWTGVVVMIFDSAPEWARVVEAHEWAMHVVPRFTEKVVEPVVPVGPPLWTRDPNFDLSYHLRRLRLPEPGGMQQLLEIAQTQAVIPLDRNRPPWVGLFVEGVEGGRSAYILQAHHVVMDGGGATQLLGRIMGRRRESHPGPLPDWTEKRSTFTPVQAASSGISHRRQEHSRGGGQSRRRVGRRLSAPPASSQVREIGCARYCSAVGPTS